MATIDNLDMSVNVNYALRIMLSEQVNSQLRMTEAASIPPQLSVVNISPRVTELDLVLGVATVAPPWAYFYMPPHFRDMRRNPFAFFRVGPSFGSLANQEKDEEKIENIVCQTPQEEAQKQTLLSCLKGMSKINDMMSYVLGRVGQFLRA